MWLKHLLGFNAYEEFVPECYALENEFRFEFDLYAKFQYSNWAIPNTDCFFFFYPPKVFTNIFCTNKILLTNISFEIMAINRKYAYWKIMLGHLYRNFEDRFQSQKRIDCEAARRFYQPFSAFLSVFQILKYFRKGTYSHKHTHTNTLNSFAVTSNDSLWLAYMFCAENS